MITIVIYFKNVIFMDNYLLFHHFESFLLQTGLFRDSFVMVSQVKLRIQSDLYISSEISLTITSTIDAFLLSSP